MIEIEPFTRIVWKSQHAKDKWNDKINAINSAYGKCELETVVIGLRRATTYHIDMNNLKSVFDLLNENNLIFMPIAQSGYYQGFKQTIP